jgi:septal ring factor EnvC (AmiA/AmiB activator)
MSRIDASVFPVTGKFLIGSIPCLITFTFENDYSYFREKVVSYKVTVKPPSLDTLKAGRRRRAAACLKAVQDDSSMTLNQLARVKENKVDLQREVESLNTRLEQLKNELNALEVEETTMKDRVELRQIQTKALSQRLEEGWDDDKEITAQ